MSWRKICGDALNAVWRNKDAWIFHNPVVESPDLSQADKEAYSKLIPVPMDFRTIKRNLPFFASPLEFERDVQQVFDNCARFNKPGQDAYEMGKDVEKFWKSKWHHDKRASAISAFEEAGAANPKIILGEAAGGKPTVAAVKSNHPVPGVSSDWRGACAGILADLKKSPDNAWFLLPVHKYAGILPEVKKQYYAVIRTPMDFETIEKNIPIYPSPVEFRKDLELVVTNCVRFNPPESVVNQAARNLQNDINDYFDQVYVSVFSSVRGGEWGKLRRIPPSPPPEDLVPPADHSAAAAAAPVVRFKRVKFPAPPDYSISNGPKPPEPKMIRTSLPPTTIPKISREMNPAPTMVSDWRQLAMFVLHELDQIKDDESSGGNQKLTWIFQKPIFKYDLPNQIKRLYLLSVHELVDLQTITGRLESRLTEGYANPLEFEHDVTRMFDNCLAFNDESQYPHKVGFVLATHFDTYWHKSGISTKAMEMWRAGNWTNSTPTIRQTYPPLRDIPNWDELRNTAATEAAIKPLPDFEHSINAANTPFNDELLYEWRVSQRFVMQKLRREKMAKKQQCPR